MSIEISDQDKKTLQTAAYGAVALLTAADATGSPGRVAAAGSIALGSATGAIGHALADPRHKELALEGRSVADLADVVLPALGEALALLEKQDAAEASNFRRTVAVALEAGIAARKREPGPVVTDMVRKINEAMGAA